MQQEIKVRELAEQFFKDEINKLDDPQRKEEVEHEEETYIGVWMLGFRAGEQHHGTSVWVKATTRLPETYGLITWRWIDKSAAYAGYDELRGFIFGTGGARVDPTYYTEIEWLDEGESPSKEGNKVSMDWIDVNDRLPELETKVIVLRPNEYSKKNDVLMAYLHDSGEVGRSHGRLGESKWLYGHYWSLPAIVEFKTITHWLPLPVTPQYNQQKEGMK